MKKFLSLFISLILILGIVLVLRNQKSTLVTLNPVASTDASPSSNVTIKDGVQYITIDAKRGYFPQATTAKGGIPTKIIAKTNESYGCETSLVIRSAKYQAYLPPTGSTEVDLGTPKSGETTDGVCGMGMYSFEVKYM